MMADFERDMSEADRTHIAETLNVTDMRHWSFGAPPEWKDHCEANEKYRDVHHHVFDLALTRKAVCFAHFRDVVAEYVFPFHIAVFATK